MNIHHSQIKRAEKFGVVLTTELEYARVKAFWPKHNTIVYGADGKWALEQMLAVQQIVDKHSDNTIQFHPDPAQAWATQIVFDGVLLPNSMTPIQWRNEDLLVLHDKAANGAPQPADKITAEPPVFVEDQEPSINGVPTNGARAYAKGFTAADCPWEDGDIENEDQFVRWNEEWDAAADANQLEDEPADGDTEEKAGSVVKSKYRAIYAERGHPAHCGDELAVRLNQIVAGGAKTDIETFKRIVEFNDIDMSKYNTTNPGWQGRYRMTGRNKLAKKAHSNGGLIKMPFGDDIQLSQEWVQAQRFK